MAIRKFLFMNGTEGFAQEQASSDELSIGKLTLVGINGVAIDAGAATVSNLAAPVTSTDAARKFEVDAAADAAANALADEVDAREQAELALQGAIDDEAQARADADSALEDAYIAADAVVLSSANAYTDSVASGFYVKDPAKAVATANITLSGPQTIDGVSLVAGDRVLVVGQDDATKNGIYVVAASAWSRSGDANSDAEVKDGMSVWIEQGTDNKDSTWVLTTNNTIVLGTTELSFRQFSGLGQIVAGDGLAKSGNTISVNVGNGTEISGDAVVVKLASNPGLKFTDGALDAKVDGTRAMAKDADGLFLKLESDAGMEFDAVNGGLELKLVSSDRLTKSSSGLDVVGLPSAFKIDGTAVNSGVTAARLTELVTNTAPVTYHFHSDVKQLGNFAPASTTTLAIGTALYAAGGASAGAGIVNVAAGACTDAAKSRIIGLVTAETTVNGGSNATFQYLTHGIVGGLSGLSSGVPYYLGSAGTPVAYASLTSGDRVIRLGYAVSATELFVAVQDMGLKA